MILYITRKFPPSIGGMENLNGQLYSHLRDKAQTHLIAWGGSQRWLVFVFWALCVRAIWALWRSPQIGVILIGDSLLAPLGLLLKTLFGKPVVIIACGLDITWPFAPYQFIIPRCLKRLDRVVSISQETKAECVRRGVPEKKVIFIPIGIKVDQFHRVADNREPLAVLNVFLRRDLSGRKIILTVGRLVKRKGVCAFVKNVMPELVRQRSDVVYLVVGEGAERQSIEQAIVDLNLQSHVILAGLVGDEVLHAAYACADIFVMPNIRVPDDMEGFGIVALEAAAAGLPVVASNLEGIRAAVQDGANGILIDAGDYARYTSTVLRFLNDEESRRAFGEQARTFVSDHYSWERIAEQYLSLTKTLAGIDQKG